MSRWHYNSPYKFNGKELDEETGLYYYGARYYNPRTSIWLSVDPLAEKTMTPYQYCYQNPVKLIDPNGEEPTPAEAARMAAYVYADGKNIDLKGGWKVSSRDVGLKESDYNNKTGLQSTLFERLKEDGTTEYTYATAGTDEKELKDYGANAKQVVALSSQYNKSVKNAKIIDKALGNDELTFTGHSLGGGTSSANAIVTGRKAITFNAAGLSFATKIKLVGFSNMFNNYDDIVTAYQIRSDPLTILQDILPMASALGDTKLISPGKSDKGGHSIINMIDGLENPKPFKPKQSPIGTMIMVMPTW